MPAHVEIAPQEIAQLLRDSEVEFELLSHRRTLSAAGEARALEVPLEKTTKTVVVRVDGGCVRAVVPASSRLDLERLGIVVGAVPVLLSEAELDGCYPDFELGAVPPVGGPAGDRVVVDRGLLNCNYIVFEAGTHELSLRLRPYDLLRVTDGVAADIATG